MAFGFVLCLIRKNVRLRYSFGDTNFWRVMRIWKYLSQSQNWKYNEDLKFYNYFYELKQNIKCGSFMVIYYFMFVPAGLWITHWANSEETNPFLLNNLCETRLSSSIWTQGTRPRSSIFSAVFFNRKLATPLFLKSSLVLNIPATPNNFNNTPFNFLLVLSYMPVRSRETSKYYEQNWNTNI